jgi:hypothetical protein
VFEDTKTDEFASYFENKREPKVVVTTTTKPSEALENFAKEFSAIIGEDNSEYRPRKPLSIKQITNECIERDYTDLVVISEHREKPRMFSTAIYGKHINSNQVF